MPRFRHFIARLLTAVALLGVVACGDSTSSVVTGPPEPRTRPMTLETLRAQAPLEAQAFLAVNEDRVAAARLIIQEMTDDARLNTDARFGPKGWNGRRDMAQVCQGIRTVLLEYLPRLDETMDVARTDRRREQVVNEALANIGCATAPGAIFGASLLRLGRPPVAAPPLGMVANSDSIWVEQNLRESVVDQAMTGYAGVAPGNWGAFMGGMTGLESEVFSLWACELDETLASTSGGGGGGPGGGELPTSIFSLAARDGCSGMVAGGCVGMVAANWRSTVSAAIRGFAKAGFWGAVGAGGASAVTDCAVGGAAGYLACIAME